MNRIVLCIVATLTLVGIAIARPTYRGYSGAPGATGTCASSCHGSGGGTVQITGFPTQYIPDSTYLITITATSGSSINNFNGSVRVGTGSTNAGTISAGTNTATHNVAGETNGIHLSSNNRTSGTFNWLAPAAGTGAVHLYVGAHQGSSMGGANTAINLTASEAVIESPPDQATNPIPGDGEQYVDILNTQLSWESAIGATSYEVFIGAGEPYWSLGTVTTTSIIIPDVLNYETAYEWRVDATNQYGTTTGTVWHFTTVLAPPPLPGLATNPTPANNASNVPVILTQLSWTAAEFAEDYDIYWGQTEPLEFIGPAEGPSFSMFGQLAHSRTYMWRVDARNITGTTTGEIWSFTTEAVNAAHDELVANEFSLGEAYPNPFNSSVRINLNIPTESQATVSIFDQTGRLVSTLLDNARETAISSWNGMPPDTLPESTSSVANVPEFL
ncbi:MAG: T9SS type A sorting domain-containing protein [bacterium]|nr:T9SS type A sorting domain-containing protein [bacterium]